MALKSLKDAASTIAGAYGDNAGGQGFEFPQVARLRTGILTLDISLGGGIPLGAVSLIYGNESSGKTSLCLRIAAQFQRAFPNRRVCWIDVEGSWDKDWVTLHGVDPKLVYLYKPTTAEEAADVAKELAMSEDAGLIVVDSIAALSSIQQLEKSAEQVVVAGAAKPSTQLLRNIGAGISEHSKAGQLLTAIYINQPRTKIGFVMGNPEFLPGPVLQNFQADLKLRLSAKAVLKEKLAAVPIYNDTSARVVKKKFPCVRQNSAWQMALYPYEGGTAKSPVKVKPLEVNNRHHLKAMLLERGWLTQEGTGKDAGWVLHSTGEVFKTQAEGVEAALEDYDGTVEFAVDELLMLYKDEVKDFVQGKSDMSG
jgi:recombination protein RecA